jgi:hypothetical protein
VLLAAHFVSVLCVVLRDFRKIWIDIISIHMFIWIHMQNKNSLPLTDHVNCASRRFFGFYFFSIRGTKTFFSLSRGKIVWRQMVRSTHAVRKIRSIRNCTVEYIRRKEACHKAAHSTVGEEHKKYKCKKKIPLSSQVHTTDIPRDLRAHMDKSAFFS